MKPSQVDSGPVMSMAFSNAGHVFTHMLTILYATAVLYLPGEFDLAYGEMLGLSSVGLIPVSYTHLTLPTILLV